MKLTGQIRKGRRIYDNPAAVAIANMDVGEGRRFEETFERWRPIRSDQANRRYWGLLIPLAQHVLSQTRDLPLSKEQVHFVLVSAFAGCDITSLGPVPVPTRSMDTGQFSTYCEKVQAWLADAGIAVPEMNEQEVSA